MGASGGERKKAVVTGASGFLGRAVCERLAVDGWDVERWCRSTERVGLPARPFRLGERIDPSALSGVSALVHAAHSLDEREWEDAWRVNGEGSIALARAAHSAGVGRIVFVSSMAAHPRAESVYGRCKLRTETELRRLGPLTIVRPGTIVGPGGIFAQVSALAAKLPVLPVIEPWLGPKHRLQTAWIGDIAEALARILALPPSPSPVDYDLADENGAGIREFHRLVARSVGRRPLLIQIPLEAVLPLVRAAEALGLRLPIRSDNLLGIRSLRHFETRASWERLGIRPRGLREALS